MIALNFNGNFFNSVKGRCKLMPSFYFSFERDVMCSNRSAIIVRHLKFLKYYLSEIRFALRIVATFMQILTTKR